MIVHTVATSKHKNVIKKICVEDVWGLLCPPSSSCCHWYHNYNNTFYLLFAWCVYICDCARVSVGLCVRFILQYTHTHKDSNTPLCSLSNTCTHRCSKDDANKDRVTERSSGQNQLQGHRSVPEASHQDCTTSQVTGEVYSIVLYIAHVLVYKQWHLVGV